MSVSKRMVILVLPFWNRRDGAALPFAEIVLTFHHSTRKSAILVCTNVHRDQGNRPRNVRDSGHSRATGFGMRSAVERSNLSYCASQHGDRGAGEGKGGGCVRVDGGADGRTVGIGVAFGAVGAPNILVGAKCDHRDSPCKVPARMTLAARKLKFDGMGVGRVLVDEHEGPVAVG